jgi:transposase InsO family protein
MAKHENQILHRIIKANKRRILFSMQDKLFYVFFSRLSSGIKVCFSLVTPETVLRWYRNFLKKRWDFSGKATASPGRPPTPMATKQLVLQMKNENLLWGNGKIQGELLKLGISLDKRTIAGIIAEFRKKGKVKHALTWKKFIKAQLDSLFGMDFFTVNSLWGHTFYVLFIISLKTREIVEFKITEHPNKNFVQQSLLNWRWDWKRPPVYLIHDNDSVFNSIDYSGYDIKDVRTSLKAPNMNAVAERFVRSVRTEALDNFVIFNRNQLMKIMKKYIEYYNTKRAHQGIRQQVPAGYEPQEDGKVISIPVLSGLHHHYQRKTA